MIFCIIYRITELSFDPVVIVCLLFQTNPRVLMGSGSHSSGITILRGLGSMFTHNRLQDLYCQQELRQRLTQLLKYRINQITDIVAAPCPDSQDTNIVEQSEDLATMLIKCVPTPPFPKAAPPSFRNSAI